MSPSSSTWAPASRRPGTCTTPHRRRIRPAETGQLLDSDEPVGLIAITIGHYLSDADGAGEVFAAYRDALAPGSWLAITRLTDDFAGVDAEAMARSSDEITRDVLHPRSKDEVPALFGDFELVPPGLVTTSQWRPDPSSTPAPDQDGMYAGVARKPS